GRGEQPGFAEPFVLVTHPYARPDPHLAHGVALPAALRFGGEKMEVDCHSHREIAGAVGVKLVARPAGRAFGHELRLEAAGLRVARRLLDVDHAVEQAPWSDEFLSPLSLLILLVVTSH